MSGIVLGSGEQTLVDPIFLGREMDSKINEQIHEQSEERQPGIHHGSGRL